MEKYRSKILLAVDGSDQAFEAVRYVSRLFPPNKIKVVLFNVITKVPESFWDIEKEPAYKQKITGARSWELQQKEEAQKVMEKARQLFFDKNFPDDAVDIKIQGRKVGIARDIINEAQNKYDGVVVGRWGMSMLKDFLSGSIASKLIANLVNIPLCVVGGAPQTGKMLLAIDTSKTAMKVIDYVGAIVDSSHWEVTLFHAIRNIDKKVLHKAEQSMDSVFKEASIHLERAGFNRNQITTRMVTEVLSRSGAIFVEAMKGEYGTIVVGRRGLSNVAEFDMGRVSNKVIQMARKKAVWVVT